MLRIVDAIHSRGSILKAAAALGMSQPALTKSLHELEGIVQVKLFERHNRGVEVTEAGKQLIARGRRILAEVLRLEEDLDLLSSLGGDLVAVGTLPVAATGIIPGVLIDLRSRYPGIRVRLHEGRTEELLALLASRELDVVVGRFYDMPKPDGLIREPLWAEPISFLARSGHPIFSGALPDAERIRQYDLILPTVTQRVNQEIEQVLATLNLEASASMRSNSYGFIREMLLGTDVICAMPRLMMLGDLLRGALKVVPLVVPMPDRPAGIILSGGLETTAATHAFAHSIRHYIQKISDQGLVTPLEGLSIDA